MWGKIKCFIGWERHNDYIKKHLARTNCQSGIYLSCIIIALETWMIFYLSHYLAESGVKRSASWIFGHYFSYVLLLMTGIFTLIFCIRMLRGGIKNETKVGIWMLFFITICLVFGIYVSYNDYCHGEQILTFVAMEVFAVCLLSWRPISSFLILVFSFGTFYILIAREAEISFATDFNLFVFWIAVFMVSAFSYNQKVSEAKNADSLREANAHLQRLAVCDELTGIANFHYFQEHVPEILKMEEERLKDFSVLFLNIENFKSYNEKHGFEKGNMLLKELAHQLEDNFKNELVARFSDDHFVVLTKRENAKEIINEWSERLHSEHPLSGLMLKCGAYKPKNSSDDPRQACDYARYACELTKRRYDLNYKVYDEDMDREFKLRRYVVNNIDVAVKNEYIKVFYQPVVWADTHKLCGVEALARWIDPNYGFLSPGVFVPVLEEYRQIHKLDICIMHRVCKDIRLLQDQKTPTVPVSINFSRLDFELADICGELERTVEELSVPKEYLHVEVTESALSSQDGLLQEAIRRLQDEDFQVWLDDFGSGYSSLNVLKDYNFDVMKIDMQFLENFASNQKTKEILKRIVDMAGILPMGTLTEGVETEEEAEFLSSIGCKRLQGYHFGKPMPLEDLLKQIDEGKLVVSDEFL